MIVFRRLGGELIALNPDLVERVEVTPDTVVTLVGEKKFLVEETLEEVLALITDYRAYVMARAQDLHIDAESGRFGGPVLHVVPNEHVATPGVIASGEDFGIYSTPDDSPDSPDLLRELETDDPEIDSAAAEGLT